MRGQARPTPSNKIVCQPASIPLKRLFLWDVAPARNLRGAISAASRLFSGLQNAGWECKILTGLFRVDVILRIHLAAERLSLARFFTSYTLRLQRLGSIKMYWIKALERSAAVYLWQELFAAAANLSCAAAGELARAHGQQPLPLSLSAVARGQLIILALPIPHLQQHTGIARRPRPMMKMKCTISALIAQRTCKVSSRKCRW